ncbi:MAG: methyltransferase domain-containing protein [Syntrophomonadaceae bacterium]|jgi:tRNA G37 N-methylase Trm5|nr:methyltransferase domain-containing protein [Syntrophomonadaceae bacterium]
MNAVQISREIINQTVKQGDIVIDATCGRGNDTLLLARLVGAAGRVYSFDIQESALQSARILLETEQLNDRVKLINADHAQISLYIDEKIHAAMFNLGYLPGGSHQITTKSLTTIKAVGETLGLLAPGGIITIVAYPGHESGAEELQELRNYLSTIPQQQFDIIAVSFLNQINCPPQLIVVQKLEEAP